MRKKTLWASLVLFSIMGLCSLGWAEEFDTPYSRDNQLDINRASFYEVSALPVSIEKARSLFDYVQYRSYLKSIYEIRRIPGFDQETFDRVKPLIKVVPVKTEDEELQRMNEIYYKISQWASTEGTNEGLVDLWIDLAKDPLNVNTATLYDLMNLQNVSPPDAMAIVKERERRGRIADRRELSRIPGLSGWGYSNARDFLRYEEREKGLEFHGDYQFRINNTPYDPDLLDALHEESEIPMSWWDRLSLGQATPHIRHKIRLRLGPWIKAGAALYRNQGEEDFSNFQWYLGLENQRLGALKFKRIYLGSYLVSFGQGLVMENIDYFKPRKSGFGWDKRFVGIVGDISGTEEFALRGGAAELSLWKFDGIFFYSDDKKDAILNEDGSVNSLIILTPKLENSVLKEAGLSPMHDVLREQTYGGNLRYNIFEGTHVGLSFYESLYDRFFNPDSTTVVARIDKLVPTDSEYLRSYRSPGKYRRVHGAEFQTILKNVSVQGEYAELEVDGEWSRVGDDPHGVVLSAFTQYENLSLLGLYRNYDVAYDNPYSRGFSNYERFKGTIFEDEYYLADPLYGMIFDNSVMPQAEEGFYFTSRYRFADKFTPQVEYDVWTRKADNSHYRRIVFKLEYRPIFPFRLDLRHKWQGRNEANPLTYNSFTNIETRLQLQARLSRYDRMEFIFVTSHTQWPPRPRLTDKAEPADTNDYTKEYPVSGNAASPAEAMGVQVTHNFNDDLSLRAFFGLINGFFWTFEDNEFLVLDEKAYRYWISVSDRISDRLALRFKYTVDRNLPLTYVDARMYNQNIPPVEADPDAWLVREKSNSYRLQIDYSW